MKIRWKSKRVYYKYQQNCSTPQPPKVQYNISEVVRETTILVGALVPTNKKNITKR